MLRGFEFRRDGRPTSPVPARTATATIRGSNTNGATSGATYANNWIGTPTTVANAQTFNLPALTKPATPPAQFLVKLPFTNITAHAGQDESLWELVVTSSSNGSYYCDAHFTAASSGTVRAIEIGCPNGSSRFDPSHSPLSTASKVELYYSMSRAPADSPGIVLIGATNPDLQLPNVCTKLYSQPVVSLNHGIANSSGTIPGKHYSIGPWNPT